MNQHDPILRWDWISASYLIEPILYITWVISSKILTIVFHSLSRRASFGAFSVSSIHSITLWRHNERHGISNHQPHDCLLNCLFRRRSKKTSNLHVTGLCEGNSLVTGEFPTQRASNTENISIWWCHHDLTSFLHCCYHVTCNIMLYKTDVKKSVTV